MLDLLLEVLHLLLAVAREPQLLLEAPENRWSGFDGGFAEHVMQNDHLQLHSITFQQLEVILEPKHT